MIRVKPVELTEDWLQICWQRQREASKHRAGSLHPPHHHPPGMTTHCCCSTTALLPTCSQTTDYIKTASTDSTLIRYIDKQHRDWAKKVNLQILSKSLANTDRLSIFFHWHILWRICNNVIIKYSTTPHLCRYTSCLLYTSDAADE